MPERAPSLESRVAELEAELERLRAKDKERERDFELHKQIVMRTPVGMLLARLEEPGNPGSFRFLWGNDVAFAASYVPREQV